MRKTLVIAALVILLLQSSSLVWAWEIERPHRSVNIKDRVDNSSTNGEASVGIGVAVNNYVEDFSDYGGDDFVTMNVSMTANSRRGITYNYYSLGGLLWWDVYDLAGISGDDEGSWVDIPQDPYTFEFRFYGGWASAEYKRVWVCTNGFISFDRSNSTSPYPSSLPSSSEPNALIAALWADLIVDAAANITTGIVTYLSNFYFVISWNNVLHKASGERLTFQIILDAAKYPSYDPANVQSQIWISYKILGPISGFYTIGIEDHEGNKGAGPGRVNWDLTNLEGETLEFYQSSSSFFLKGLTIKLEEDDPDARVYIRRAEPTEFIRGINVKRKSGETPEPDYAYTFLKAFAGTAILLLEAKSGILLFKIAGGALIGLDWVDMLAYWMEDKVDPIDLRDSFDGPNPPLSHGGYINATTQYDYGVDSVLGIVIHWIFGDSNTLTHSLKITAELEYFEYTSTGEVIDKPPITTSVYLEVAPDDNDNPNAADPISVGNYTLLYLDYDYDPVDYYKINMPDDHAIRLEMEPPSYANYNLYLYDPDLILKASSEKGTGETETIYYECRYAGDWYINVSAVSAFGFYNLSIGMQVLPSNNPPDVPSAPYGTGGGVGTSYTFYTSTTDPDGDNVCFTFDWDDGSNRTTDYYPSGYPWANASHTWSSAGTYNISVRAQDIHRTWSESWSETTEVTITGGGGGGGCPTLFSWNRTTYAEEALLDVHSNSDVTVDYTLSHLNPINRLCLLSLRELDNYTSHIDYVKLYAVDNAGIWHECNLFLAWHSELGRVNHLLALDDDERVDLAPGERTTLLFLLPKNIGDIQFFIFELNGHNPKGRPPRPL